MTAQYIVMFTTMPRFDQNILTDQQQFFQLGMSGSLWVC